MSYSKNMLSAKRYSDGQNVNAYFESKANAPFYCLVCDELVTLKIGKNRINHFAHVNPLACKYGGGESDAHRKCKIEIYKALLQVPGVTDVMLERPLGPVRPDVSAIINGVKVAIEIQISSLSVEAIMRRTIDYHRKGIYVLWLLPWTPKLDGGRYSPKLWEKWVHACYFGRIYYWVEGTKVASYSFEADFRTIPRKTWHSSGGKKMTGGGYSVRSKRFRAAVQGQLFNLATDFVPRQRYWWGEGDLKVPDAKIFMQRYEPQ